MNISYSVSTYQRGRAYQGILAFRLSSRERVEIAYTPKTERAPVRGLSIIRTARWLTQSSGRTIPRVEPVTGGQRFGLFSYRVEAGSSSGEGVVRASKWDILENLGCRQPWRLGRASTTKDGIGLSSGFQQTRVGWIVVNIRVEVFGLCAT